MKVRSNAGSMTPRDLANRMRDQRVRANMDDGYKRETFTLPRDEARTKAREWLKRYPAAGYGSEVESHCELPDGRIEFTMRRRPTAD